MYLILKERNIPRKVKITINETMLNQNKSETEIEYYLKRHQRSETEMVRTCYENGWYQMSEKYLQGKGKGKRSSGIGLAIGDSIGYRSYL